MAGELEKFTVSLTVLDWFCADRQYEFEVLAENEEQAKEQALVKLSPKAHSDAEDAEFHSHAVQGVEVEAVDNNVRYNQRCEVTEDMFSDGDGGLGA